MRRRWAAPKCTRSSSASSSPYATQSGADIGQKSGGSKEGLSKGPGGGMGADPPVRRIQTPGFIASGPFRSHREAWGAARGMAGGSLAYSAQRMGLAMAWEMGDGRRAIGAASEEMKCPSARIAGT
ncbi:hypothetical protein TARUN_9441 [Trichoderma arundinaceum]|uniref:Uncharacterized protein n=1 Tax=Trichoderma arundinaceum TaxID=490622 RepID=A0A395N9L0_TRIAR|nr:hypothetical protein TARUN_9441 [Trichoderma arundinaceum]